MTKKFYSPRHWTTAQRLAHYTKVEPVSGCHIWQGSLNRQGYGQCPFAAGLPARIDWPGSSSAAPSPEVYTSAIAVTNVAAATQTTCSSARTRITWRI